MPSPPGNPSPETRKVSRRGIASNLRMIVREAARAERAQQQAQARLEAAHRRAVREAERQAKADSKEAARLHLASQIEEAELLTEEIREREQAINALLTRALAKNPAIDLEAMLKTFVPASFDETPWTSSAPDRHSFMPSQPSFFARIVPGAARRHQRAQEEAGRLFDAANAAHIKRILARAEALEAFETTEAARKAALERDNDCIREMQRDLASGEHAAVTAYFKLVVDRSLEGEPDAVSAEIGYSPESRHMVVDLELPEFSVIPEESGFKYIKSADRIEAVTRPEAKRKALYAHLISQVALKSIATVFRGDVGGGTVDCLTVNGMLDTIDPASGQKVRLCLLSVRITADTFGTLNLAQVQPEHCLRSLKASVSRAPAELLPVNP